MARQIIRLTESDLHKIIKEAVKKSVKQIKEAESVRDRFNTYHQGPWGDWRDEYDEYMNAPFGSNVEGLRQNYLRAAKRDFGDDKKAFAKALSRHSAYRDENDPFLSPQQRIDREVMDSKYNAEHDFNTDDASAGGEEEPKKKTKSADDIRRRKKAKPEANIQQQEPTTRDLADIEKDIEKYMQGFKDTMKERGLE